MAKPNLTTIQVSKDTREELKTLGSKGETYDEIIRKLIKHKKESDQR